MSETYVYARARARARTHTGGCKGVIGSLLASFLAVRDALRRVQSLLLLLLLQFVALGYFTVCPCCQMVLRVFDI